MDEKRDLGSLLGQGSAFKGKLTFLGTVRVEGKLEGEVLTDDTLVVADGGEVRGNLNVGTLIITGGLVDATVRAKDAVEIHPGGHLKGEVFSPVMQIERGAIFEGQSHMTDPENDDTPAGAETLPELPDPPEPTDSDLGDLDLDD